MFNYIAKANNLLIQDLDGDMVQTRGGSITFKSPYKQDHLVVEAGPDDRSIL